MRVVKNTEGAIRPKVRNIAEEPTEMDIEEHDMHHAEFGQWCPHCVKGKAVSYGHKSSKECLR